MFDNLTDAELIAAYEAERGEGDRADEIAAEMERRNLDY